MNFIDEINKSTLIICSSADAKQILHYLDQKDELFDIKLMTLEELKNHLYFTYDEKSIYYLMYKYSMKYEVAVMYLKNIIYASDNTSDFAKLNQLAKYKKELIDNDLLIYDDLFKQYLTTKEVLLLNYDETKELKSIFNDINKITNCHLVYVQSDQYQHQVYEFDTLEEEVQFVANRIASLVVSGVSINKIKLTNLNNDYLPTIRKIFEFYNIKLNLNSDEAIYGTEVAKIFLDCYEADINKTLLQLASYQNDDIYNSIVAICNKYLWCNNYLEVKELIVHDLKTTMIKNVKYDNALEIIDYKNSYVDKDFHIFMLNFNEGSIPISHKDEDYLPDSIKLMLGLDTSVDKNMSAKNNALNKIKSIKNLTITYKLKTPFRSFYPSVLVDEFIVTKGSVEILTSYSSANDQINLAKEYDKLIKFGSLSVPLSILNSSYEIDYRTYDHRYKQIDISKLKTFLNSKLYLSYSAMDNYSKCAFKYYVGNVLRLNIYEDTLATKIGLIFHHILEIGLKQEININYEVDEYCKTLVINTKEKFFIDKLKGELEFIIKTIKKQMTNCNLDKTLYEEKIVINKENNIQVKFTGFIDKILYKEEDQQTIVALIDYKTGSTDIDLQYFPYGLGMQLPIYLYLAKNSKLNNIKFAGFYLQKILNPPKNIDHSKNDEQLKEKSLKLYGYSNSNMEVLQEFDQTYQDSEVVNSLKVKTDGTFYSNAKVLSEKQIDQLIELTDQQIDNCVDSILDADFKINPKKDQKNIGCLYCEFKDICYMQESDCEIITSDKDLTFLGGEMHDEVD